MTKYIAILRGINVGGKKSINMEELKVLFRDLKFSNVKNYIQSGNIIFESEIRDQEKLANLISQKIYNKYNFNVPVIIRNSEEIENIFKNNPLLKNKNFDINKLHVTFLSLIPNPENLKSIKEKNYSPDEFIVNNKEIYLKCPNGYGKTKLSNNFFENKLKVTATTRNWKTVIKFMELMKG